VRYYENSLNILRKEETLPTEKQYGISSDLTSDIFAGVGNGNGAPLA